MGGQFRLKRQITTTKRQDLKERLLRERPFCGARKFRPHECAGGLDMHEALYKRNDVPPELQGYLWDERNCVLICNWSHMQWGQRHDFNEVMADTLVEWYGRPAIEDYLFLAPFKIKTPLDYLT